MGKPRAAADSAYIAKKKEPAINIRMARVGLGILNGKSTKQALIAAGYAEATARRPTGNGLTAERCLLEASKLDRSADPGTMLEAARRLQLKQIRAILSAPESQLLDKTLALTIPRITETVERYHGAVDARQSEREDRSFVQRAVIMKACIHELEKRGLLRDENADSRDPGRVVDALPAPASKEKIQTYPPPTKEPEY